MARHTNMRVGGPARWYCSAQSAEELCALVAACRAERVPWFVIGGGSNTLVADAGYDGLVIQMAMRDIAVGESRVTADPGAITAAVAREASEAGLTGFEWAISLPGTIGGAVRGNAGCFGGEMKDVVEEVVVGEMTNNECRMTKYGNRQCAFRYRHSIFKEQPGLVVLGVTLRLAAGNPSESQKRMAEFLARRKAKQPLERPSAGCLFTNVLVDSVSAEQSAKLDAAGDWRAAVHDGQLPTGWIVEHLSMKGHRVGNAQVSAQHGNFVVNLGGATATDVAAVSDAVRAKALEVFGIDLHEEVQRVGFA